jgi:hypothetical protein
MAEFENEVEGRRRVLESVQHPRYPVESGVEYGLRKPEVVEVERRVAAFDPPQSWAELPEHLVEHVVAAIVGLVFPHEHESSLSVAVQRWASRLTSRDARKRKALGLAPKQTGILGHIAAGVTCGVQSLDVRYTGG